jgi:hypothetical protein
MVDFTRGILTVWHTYVWRLPKTETDLQAIAAQIEFSPASSVFTSLSMVYNLRTVVRDEHGQLRTSTGSCVRPGCLRQASSGIAPAASNLSPMVTSRIWSTMVWPQGAQMLVQLLAQGFGSGVADITGKVGLAPLPRRPLKVPLDGTDQPSMGVRDHQIDPGESTALEPGEEGGPTALRFTVPQLQPQDLPVARGVDANGNQGAHGTDPVIFAYLEHQRVGEATISLRFWREGERSRWETLDQQGDLTLVERPWLPWHIEEQTTYPAVPAP